MLFVVFLLFFLTVHASPILVQLNLRGRTTGSLEVDWNLTPGSQVPQFRVQVRQDTKEGGPVGDPVSADTSTGKSGSLNVFIPKPGKYALAAFDDSDGIIGSTSQFTITGEPQADPASTPPSPPNTSSAAPPPGSSSEPLPSTTATKTPPASPDNVPSSSASPLTAHSTLVSPTGTSSQGSGVAILTPGGSDASAAPIPTDSSAPQGAVLLSSKKSIIIGATVAGVFAFFLLALLAFFLIRARRRKSGVYRSEVISRPWTARFFRKRADPNFDIESGAPLSPWPPTSDEKRLTAFTLPSLHMSSNPFDDTSIFSRSGSKQKMRYSGDSASVTFAPYTNRQMDLQERIQGLKKALIHLKEESLEYDGLQKKIRILEDLQHSDWAMDKTDVVPAGIATIRQPYW